MLIIYHFWTTIVPINSSSFPIKRLPGPSNFPGKISDIFTDNFYAKHNRANYIQCTSIFFAQHHTFLWSLSFLNNTGFLYHTGPERVLGFDLGNFKSQKSPWVWHLLIIKCLRLLYHDTLIWYRLTDLFSLWKKCCPK